MTSLSAAVRNINHTTQYNISAQICLGYYRFELTDFPKKKYDSAVQKARSFSCRHFGRGRHVQ